MAKRHLFSPVLISGILAAMTTGCNPDEVTPLAPDTPSASAAAEDRPFYYYDHQRVDLELDPTRVVVARAQAPDPSEFAAAGLRVAASRRLPQMNGHWLLELQGGHDAAHVNASVKRLRALRRFDFVGQAYRVRSDRADVVLLNRVAVRFKDEVTKTQIDSLASAFGLRQVRAPSEKTPVYWYAYPLNADADPLTVAAQLDEHPLVLWADPDKVSNRRQTSIPNDAYFGLQYYLKNTATRNGIPVDINITPAWDYMAANPRGHVLQIAVVDDGVEARHPEFGTFAWGGVVQWFSWDAFAGNGGALVNDQCTDCPTNPAYGDTHGTSVAGMIAALHNNGGIAGAAQASGGVSIKAVRIFRGTDVATDAAIATALDQTAGVTAVNNSWGGGAPSNAITDAIRRGANDYRTVFVFAAGNNSLRSFGIIGQVVYPASLPEVIAVSAINRTGGVADYSPNGSAIDLVAPSGNNTGTCVGDVITLEPLNGGCDNGPNGDPNYTSTFSGTSAAAPQVTAIAGMVGYLNTNLSAAQIRGILVNNADSWGSATTYGGGKLNADRAVRATPPQ